MWFFDKIFKKNKSCYKISNKLENNLVVMVTPKNKVKLNSKIVVPNNFCAVLLSKEKFLDVIPSGEYELNGFTINLACKANKLDKNRNLNKKDIKADFYFVNLNICKIKNTFNIKKIKNDLYFSLSFKITKPIKFLKFIKDERAVFDNSFAQKHFCFSVSRLIYYYVLDSKHLEKAKFVEYVKKELDKIGVEVLELDLELNSSENETNNNYLSYNKKEQNFVLNQRSKELQGNLAKNCEFNETKCNLQNSDLKNSLNNESLQQKSNFDINNFKSLVNLEEIKSESISYFTCDCGAKLTSNAKECYNCHKSFVEKNLCENCGREIKKGIYVCPYCNAVLFNN